MTRRSRTPHRWALALMVVVVGGVAVGPAAGRSGRSPDSRTAHAAAPSPDRCRGNNAFCGAALRIDSRNGTIPSVAAGAHYGPAWGIPTSPNDSAGTGWCVDDTHTGFPAGAIVEQPLPETWTRRQHRVAAAIIALYGGDRVLPYQGLAVDDSGELIATHDSPTNPTRQRHVAVWLALRSVLPDPAGTPRIDLSSAQTFSDIAGRSPSNIGGVAVPLARRMVHQAEALAPQGEITMAIEFGGDDAPHEPGKRRNVNVRLTDESGRPLASYPVWPSNVADAAVIAAAFTPVHDSVAVANVAASGWLSFDTSVGRNGATLTNTNGVATFEIEVGSPAPWSVEFTSEGPPLELRLFGDDIRAQNNVTLDDTEPTIATATLAGDLSRRHITVAKTSSDPRFEVAGAVFALFDSNDDEIDRGTTGVDGLVSFAPFDDADHPPPYVVRELVAPPGLQRISGDISVTSASGEVSTQSHEPTIVRVENVAIEHELVVQKVISGAPGAPADLSGFEFTVSRTSGSPTDPDPPVAITTGTDGRTPPLSLPSGSYSIEEVGRPRWWPADQPLPAPTEVIVSRDRDESEPAMIIEFDNTFPAPTIPPTTTATTTTTTTTTTMTSTTLPPSPLPPSTVAPVPTTSGVPVTTTTTVATTTTLPPVTTTTSTPTTSTSTTSTPTAVSPTTTSTTVAPAAVAPPLPESPALPRTGDEAWRSIYRMGVAIVFIGSAIFFASTLGIRTPSTGRSRRAGHRSPAASPAPHDLTP